MLKEHASYLRITQRIRIGIRLLFIILAEIQTCLGVKPFVITTWKFPEAVQAAWNVLDCGGTGIDALEAGCGYCEFSQCKLTVGFGGSPDEVGETTLDAMIFDGKTMDVGAVADLRRVKKAISVAKYILRYTEHSLLAGNQATNFAIAMGFKNETLSTNVSIDMWKQWEKCNCQPNFWKNVIPDPSVSCGPYTPRNHGNTFRNKKIKVDDSVNVSHDTIGMIIIDKEGNIAAGTSTNGLNHKIPGRVGDSSVPGAGAYAENLVGGACATGNGDIMMRFLPSFVAVEEMRRGKSAQNAAKEAVRRIAKYYPAFSGAVIAVNNKGAFGVACNYMDQFPFVIMNNNYKNPEIQTINCTNTPAKYNSFK